MNQTNSHDKTAHRSTIRVPCSPCQPQGGCHQGASGNLQSRDDIIGNALDHLHNGPNRIAMGCDKHGLSSLWCGNGTVAVMRTASSSLPVQYHPTGSIPTPGCLQFGHNGLLPVGHDPGNRILQALLEHIKDAGH